MSSTLQKLLEHQRRHGKASKHLPDWARNDRRGFEARLLDILLEGGERKLPIILAWATWAGFQPSEVAATLHRLETQRLVARRDGGRDGIFLGLLRPRQAERVQA